MSHLIQDESSFADSNNSQQWDPENADPLIPTTRKRFTISAREARSMPQAHQTSIICQDDTVVQSQPLRVCILRWICMYISPSETIQAVSGQIGCGLPTLHAYTDDQLMFCDGGSPGCGISGSLFPIMSSQHAPAHPSHECPCPSEIGGFSLSRAVSKSVRGSVGR